MKVFLYLFYFIIAIVAQVVMAVAYLFALAVGIEKIDNDNGSQP